MVVLASSLDPTGMLEAMRLGITEWMTEPVSASDLEAALQRVSRTTLRTTSGRSIAVVGGKGGVGCTTIAVNLAAAIRAATHDGTLLVDLHMAQGDTSVFLGVEPRFTVLDALENIHRLDDTYFRGLVTPTPSGVDLLASANRPVLGSIDVLRVQALLEFVTGVYPWVIVDCPRSDPSVIDALDVVSTVLVVANQELPTLRSASRLAALLRQRCGTQRVKLAISRFDGESEISHKDVERVLGGAINYTFPSDYRVAVGALNKGEPLVADLARPAGRQLRRRCPRLGRTTGAIPRDGQDRAVRPARRPALSSRSIRPTWPFPNVRVWCRAASSTSARPTTRRPRSGSTARC